MNDSTFFPKHKKSKRNEYKGPKFIKILNAYFVYSMCVTPALTMNVAATVGKVMFILKKHRKRCLCVKWCGIGIRLGRDGKSLQL